MRAPLLPLLVVGLLGHAASTAAAAPPQFAPPVLYPAGDGITALAAADFSSNGTVDVIVRSPEGVLTRHEGDGRGGFDLQVVFLSGPGLTRAAMIDGDPVPDLFDVDASGAELAVHVRIADRSGDFGPVITSPGGVPSAPVRGAAAADADADGRVDLVVATGDPGADARLWVASGRGDGAFDDWRDAGTSPGTKGLLMTPDVNGDGRPELAMQDDAGRVWISLSEGDASYAPAGARDVGAAGSELGPMVTGTFALDGPPRLAVADLTRDCIALVPVEGPPPGPPDCFPAAGHVEGLIAVDLDGDNVTDLSQGTAAPDLGVLYGGLGGLSEPVRYPVPNTDFVSGPLAADLDADGKPDIVALANLRSLAVFRNIGPARAVAAPAPVNFRSRPIASEPPATPADTRAPRVFASVPPAFSARHGIRLSLRCDEDCRLTVTVSVRVSGRVHGLITRRASLAAQQRRTVVLALSRRLRARVARAQARHRKVTAVVRVRATDQRGNSALYELRRRVR